MKIKARSGHKHGKSTRLYWVQIPTCKTPFKGVETDFWQGQSSCMVTRTLPTKFGQNPSTNKKTQRRAIFGFWNGGPFLAIGVQSGSVGVCLGSILGMFWVYLGLPDWVNFLVILEAERVFSLVLIWSDLFQNGLRTSRVLQIFQSYAWL